MLKGLTKKELRQIISQGFKERRERSKIRSQKASLLTKKWKLRENLLKNAIEQHKQDQVKLLEQDIIKRQKHFLGPS